MYPFSRRAIQERLYALRDVIGEAPTAELVKRLNEKDLISLPAVWEVVVTYALSRLGNIEYETGIASRKPDVSFTSRDLRFAAEITTASDRTAKIENPIDDFMREVHRVARKLKIPGSFHYRVGALRANHKVSLRTPKRDAFQHLIKQRVRPFLREILDGQLDRHSLSLHPDYDLFLTYDRNQRFSGGSHPSFTTVLAVDRNPLWNALDKKREHLSACAVEPDRLRGIFVCDCGCDSFRYSITKAPGTFSRADIIDHFLQRATRIDFVVLFTIVDRGQHDFLSRRADYAVEIFGRVAREALCQPIGGVLTGLTEHLPKPVYNIETACHPENIRRLDGIVGGCSVSGNEITISARVLLEYLAGTISHDQFLIRCGLDASRGPFADPFKRFRDAGNLIESISLQPNPALDDDKITINFGWPDPAASPFRLLPPSEEVELEGRIGLMDDDRENK